MPAVTKCLKCRTEVSLAGHKPQTAVTCPKCGMRWVPIEAAWADESAAEEPADLDPIEPADELPPPLPPRSGAASSSANRLPPLPPPVPAGGRPGRGRATKDEDEEEPAKSNTGLILAIVGVLVLSGGGVGAYFAFGKKKDEPVAETKDPPKDKEKDRDTSVQAAQQTTNTTTTSTTRETTSKDEDRSKPLTGVQIYPRLLKNTALVAAGKSLGSGVLVHAGQRLVVTNYHVVKEELRVVVMFPAYDPEKKVITRPDYYSDNVATLGIPATVVHRQPDKDLAVLQLESIPEGVRPVPLAAGSAPTGAEVHSVGASGVDRNLFWVMSSGKVKGRAEQSFPAPWGKVEASILETDAGVNPGDSGGPVVNDRAELVGVVAHALTKQRQVSGNIDITEIRTVLATVAKERKWDLENPADLGTTTADEPEDVNKLVALLNGPDAKKRLDAAKRLGALGPDAKAAVPALVGRLDDTDADVRAAVADALRRTGLPAPADVACIERALRGTGPNGRLYALRYHAAKDRPLPEALVPLAAALLDDPSAEMRRAALGALEAFGPGCKPKALQALFLLTQDADPQVAAAADRMVTAFAPYGEADRDTLVKLSGNSRAPLRLRAMRLLAPVVPDAASAVAWFRARLRDEDAAVRREAVIAIGKWEAAAKECQRELAGLMTDPDAQVAGMAILAVVKGGGAEGTAALGKLLASDAGASARQAAADALLSLKIKEAKTAVPLLIRVTGDTRAATRAQALDQLAAFGAEAKEAVPTATARLKDDDTTVRLTALKVLAAVGPDADTAADAVAGLLTDPQPQTAAAAASTLGRLGPKALDPLTKALGQRAKIPETALVGVCQGLAALGATARPAVPALIDAATTPGPLATLAARAQAAARTGQPWDPDPVGAALAAIGGDDAADKLFELTRATYSRVGGVRVNKPNYTAEIQLWAIYVLGSLDPAGLTAGAEQKVAERLFDLEKYNPEAACQAAARVGMKRHPKKGS